MNSEWTPEKIEKLEFLADEMLDLLFRIAMGTDNVSLFLCRILQDKLNKIIGDEK